MAATTEMTIGMALVMAWLKQCQRPQQRSSRAEESMAISEVTLEACAQFPTTDAGSSCVDPWNSVV